MYRSSKKKHSRWCLEKGSEVSREYNNNRGITKFDSIIMYNIRIMVMLKLNKGNERECREGGNTNNDRLLNFVPVLFV